MPKLVIGIISAIYDYGLRVPEDISVVGFDGIQIGEFYCPKITAVEQNAEQLAKRRYGTKRYLTSCIIIALFVWNSGELRATGQSRRRKKPP